MAFVGYGEPYSESSNLSHQSPVEAIDNPIINAPPSAPPNAFQQPQQETAGGNGPPIQPGTNHTELDTLLSLFCIVSVPCGN